MIIYKFVLKYTLYKHLIDYKGLDAEPKYSINSFTQ